MPEDLKLHIQEDMKSAMRAQEKLRLQTIRMLLSAIKQREIDDQIVADDLLIVSIVNKMIKQRQDSAKQYADAHRLELAEKEQAEISILQSYLPQPFSEAQTLEIIQSTITTLSPAGMQDMGKVITMLKDKLQGRADMAWVSKKVKEILQNLA